MGSDAGLARVTVAAPADVDRFRDLVAARFGLQFEDFKVDHVTEVLERRSDANAVAVARYLDLLESRATTAELRQLARELTVGESYFFRNDEQFRALREVALPERMRARAMTRTLRILSAGCATGEEAYSIAIAIRELVGENSGWTFDIVAADVNPAVLEKARKGRYSPWSLRGTGDETRRRWFHERGRELELDQSIRAMVRFEERNLTHPDPQFWAPETFDVVFCRNMLMYLTPSAAQSVVDRIAASIARDGFLFLGHAETLRGVSRDFQLLHTHGTFYYRKREGGPDPSRLAERADVRVWDTSASWIETITRSAERVRELTERASLGQESGPGSGSTANRQPPTATLWNVTAAVDMLRRERYGDALALIDELPAGARRDPDVLILRGVLLTHHGELTEAEEVCRQLLSIDDLHAGAHYVMALCREGAGDRAGAADHDQTSAYLDPTFAAPRLHLGLLARRSGDRDAARRELTEALVLLEREDASRLLLFGGGFSREALIALCRAELARCGGPA